MTATYTKLKSGDWGIRVAFNSPSSVAVGTTVVVSKRSGETKSEIMERVLWHDATTFICAVKPSARPASSKRHYRDDDQCTCPACSSGSECLCIYGRG